MKTCIVGAIVLFGAWLLPFRDAATAAPVPETGKPSAEGIATAEKAAKEQLDKLKGGYGTVKHVKDEPLERALPSDIFFSVLFRQYPVGRVPPEGLKTSNLFAVDKEGKVKVVTDVKGLEEFFKAHVTAKTDDQLKDAARAWLRLSQEFVQDGFYEFKLMDDSTKIAEEKGNKVVSGKVVVMRGGNGEINVTLTFDAGGKLVKAENDVKVKPGPRPICQATKLLDTDPIVRRMAEQDLLIMGRAAKPYLDEQRAKAPPDLQKAIDRMWDRIVNDDR